MDKLINEQRAKRAASAREYSKQVEAKTDAAIEALNEKQRAFIKEYRRAELYTELKKVLCDGRKPSEFFKKCEWLFGDIILERHKDAFFYAVDTCNAHIFTEGWDRRTLRSADYLFYINKMCEIVSEFISLNGTDADYTDILENNITEEHQAYNEFFEFSGKNICLPMKSMQGTSALLIMRGKSSH